METFPTNDESADELQARMLPIEYALETAVELASPYVDAAVEVGHDKITKLLGHEAHGLYVLVGRQLYLNQSSSVYLNSDHTHIVSHRLL